MPNIPTALSRMRTALHLQQHSHTYVTGRLLDAGCGSMPYKRLLVEKTTEWVGLDYRPVGDVVGHIEQNDLPDDSFDTVLCTDVLHYCPDPQIAVAELARVLKPGGYLILIAPNCRADDGTARWSFPLGGLKELVTRAGLSIKHESSITGTFEDEYEAFVSWGKFAISMPTQFHGLIGHLDKNYPLLSVVVGHKPQGDTKEAPNDNQVPEV